MAKEWFKFISISQEGSFRDCPYRYYLERILKIPRVTTVQQLFGSAMHAALALFNRGLRSGTVLPFDLLVWEWQKAFGAPNDYWEYRARRILAHYIADVAPHLGKPLLVEEQFYIDITDRLPYKSRVRYILTGIIDLLTEDMALADYKVVKKIRTIQDVMQEVCYLEGVRRMLKIAPDTACRIHIIRESDPVEVVRDWMQVQQKDIDEFWDRMIGFVGHLRRRVFMKNTQSRWCHPRWCPHYGTVCHPESIEEVAPTCHAGASV